MPMLANEMRRIAEAAVQRVGKGVHGIVSAVDPVNHSVKVMVQPENVESGWLPVAALAAGTIRIARLPDPGEHVQLDPIDGDAEHLIVKAAQYDVITQPPVSPATNRPAQPGELLIVAGQASPPPNNSSTQSGQPTQNAPWWHMAPTVLTWGAGNATITVQNGSIVWKVGDHTMTMSADGLASNKNATFDGTVTGQTDVMAGTISGKSHIHPGVEPGSGSTEAPE